MDDARFARVSAGRVRWRGTPATACVKHASASVILGQAGTATGDRDAVERRAKPVRSPDFGLEGEVEGAREERHGGDATVEGLTAGREGPSVREATEKLTAALAAGDEEAVESFYRQYFDWLYAQARRFSGGRDESF